MLKTSFNKDYEPGTAGGEKTSATVLPAPAVPLSLALLYGTGGQM